MNAEPLAALPPTPASEEVEARLQKLELRVVHLERRHFESQMLVARKLAEIFKGLKQHQHLRDTQMHQALTQLAFQLAELKARLIPVVTPILTH